VLAARGAAAGATVLGIMVMARHLGRIRYGDLVVLLALMKAAAELLGPALDTALVRFAARHRLRDNNSYAAMPYVRAVLWMKLALGAALLAAGGLAARPIVSLLFKDTASSASVPPYAITLCFLGAAFTMMWAFAQACFQARQEFKRYARFELAVSVLRLTLIMLVVLAAHHLLSGGVVGVTPLLATYAIAVGVVAGVAWLRLPAGLLTVPTGLGAAAREVLTFTKWVFAACCFTSLAQRVDLFVIKYLAIAEESVGDYAGAVQLVLLGELVILTLFNVLLPKASELETAEERAAFLKRFRLPAGLAAVAVLPLILLSGALARLVLGPEFEETGRLFSILLVGTLFSMGCAPAGSVLYGMGKAGAVAALEAAKLGGIVAIGYCMARAHGVFGMAWTLAAVRGTIGVCTVVAAHVAIAREGSDRRGRTA
jgi:O-antigen/teichoic acid export membrane protein